MVGKGVEPRSSRIFHQCYVKCCKLQNLTPLTNVVPTNNGKVVDFCVDRIKYQDWAPILNALSCDLSLHSICIKCRQPVKTVLEHIDCERLAKTVNKRAVVLTNFMLTNLLEATSQCLSNTTLLTTLLLEGLPLKIPYLNPMCEALLANSSLQHLHLPRCLIGDAGCLAVCKAVRCLPNILTLDLSGCELTQLGAGYIAELVKYQKIHRYSENWVHTLRYRMPELDTMAGLRRITVCGNPGLGDQGVAKLFEVLADDLWIKALDVQSCGLTEATAGRALQLLRSNTTMVVLDLRHNADLPAECLAKLRASLRENERGLVGQYVWLASSSSSSSDGRSVKSLATKNGVKERTVASTKNMAVKYSNKVNIVKKDKDYAEVLEDQLQEEISHRQQLEELNQQLVDQMKQLKQQQIRLWANSSGSEQSLQVSDRSYDKSSSSGSSSVPIDQNTLSYIQQAFKDIYAFIKNNQCQGQCLEEVVEEGLAEAVGAEGHKMAPKRAQSTHAKLADQVKMNKSTKSAHLLGDTHRNLNVATKPEMFEKHVGDTKTVQSAFEQSLMAEIIAQSKLKSESSGKVSPCDSVVSDSSDTLVCSARPRGDSGALNPRDGGAPNPRDALDSSSEDDDSS